MDDPEPPTALSSPSLADAAADPEAGDGSNLGERKKLSREHFTFFEQLGEGSFARVFRATQISTGREFAIKVLNKKHIIKESKVEQVKLERNILNMLDHPNIIKLYCTFQDAANLYMVLEFAVGGELFTHIRRLGALNEDSSRFISAEILQALEYMHGKDVIHRDLKPENVLIGADGHIRLTDFGAAKAARASAFRRNTFTGTAEYVSPEVLRDKEAGKEADLWALGCIIFQLLAGRPPFHGGSEYLTFQQILKLEYSFPPDFPLHARDLVQRLLVSEPSDRLGATGQYQQIRSHPFFAGVSWELLLSQPAPPLVAAANAVPQPMATIAKPASDRSHKLDEQAKSAWAKFLVPNELIVHMGLVVKRVGFSSKKRQLILTDTPRLIYIDPDKMVQKGEILWSAAIRPELKNDRQFLIHIPGRTYNLEDISLGGARWVEAINKFIPK
eukprot:TRINITY_DN6222_c0_g1_i1.p1 TRINITY_DN6222_c0_g1~~TRINITY_DN6222_c0_g1_i1.p1  ORF type:complete len:445 (-),score=55.27 TRINITY_DN6222_c0_g1_i1:64-1398(-)